MSEDHQVDEQLAGLRADLDRVAELPVSERLAAFEKVNASLARQLASLDEL